ncbi:MAG TPA: TVP38/TMEM64 family protein [Nitrococcus sp.]|nr:TVP38/TMEM64 family protein [Nitrococcus sp.]
MKKILSHKGLLRAGLLLALLAAIAWAIGHRDAWTVTELQARFEAFGNWAPPVFILVYGAITILCLPGAIMTIAGGVLFGPWWGAIYNLLGATLGAALAFLVARYLASEWVAAHVGGQLGRLIKGVEQEGWRFVAFTRLVPVFPFSGLNYALGLTRISWLQYILATVVCIIPGTLAYTWIGHVGAAAVMGSLSTIHVLFIIFGSLVGLLFLPRLIRRLHSVSLAGAQQKDERE